ncbi:MAG: hypothetical protein JJT78_01820 [Leptospira sp.]|nr:hypothetical protein [Leptospira sp.]
MKKLFPILSSTGFIIFLGILVVLKIRFYDGNLSALIGIWQGFHELNPGYIPAGFVVFQEGGYDGQFFFLLSRYIFESENLPFPILDSFYFRFHRLGLSLLTGYPLSTIGFEYYAGFTLALLTIIHIISFHMMHSALPDKKKYLSLFYLFNPYSILGILLLVSDPLLISLGLISSLIIFPIDKLNFKTSGLLILAMLLFSLSLLVRETSLFLIAPIMIFSLAYKQYFKIPFLLPPLAIYLGFLIFTQGWKVPNPGTLPLRFLDMIDYPLFGFLKSWEFSELTSNVSMAVAMKQILRESVKFLLFFIYLSLCMNIINIYSQWKKHHNINREVLGLTVLMIPVLATLGVITIAEQGYWRSFDNLARMFTITTPIIIIAKAKWEGYRDYGFLYLSVALTVFLLIRVGFITKAMGFFIAE